MESQRNVACSKN